MATGVAQLTGMQPAMPSYSDFIAPYQKPTEESAKASGEIEGAKAAMEAQRTSKKAADVAGVEQTYADQVRAAPQREQMSQVTEQMAQPFVPTQENAKDLATLFTLTNIIGFAIGAGGKRNAQAAMSAMNGMMEGHQQGRADLYKQEKDKYETNMRQLKARYDALDKGLRDALEVYRTDKEAGLQKAEMTFAEQGADFYRKYAEKYGLASLLKYHEQALTGANRTWGEMKREQDRADRIRQHQEDMAQRAAQHADTMRMQQERLKLAEGGRKLGATQMLGVQTMINGMGATASAVENLQKLPEGSTLGMLPNLTSKDGILNFMRNSAARKLSSSEEKAVQTLSAGIGRSLATIEAGGRATGLVGLADQMKTLMPQAGDNAWDVAMKMADLRRIVVENVKPMVDAHIMPPGQEQAAVKLIERMEKTVPYTQEQLIEARYGGRRSIRQAGAEAATSHQEGERSTSKSGKPIVYRGGKWEYE